MLIYFFDSVGVSVVKEKACCLLFVLITGFCASVIGATDVKADTWQDGMLALRAKYRDSKQNRRQLGGDYDKLKMGFPVECGWFDLTVGKQSLGVSRNVTDYMNLKRGNDLEYRIISDAIISNTEAGNKHLRELENLKKANVPAGDKRWLNLFVKVCSDRRAYRLKSISKQVPRLAFVKRIPMKPSFYGYTEGQSDAQAESHFLPGGKLCVMTITPKGCRVEDLLEDPKGVIRDLDVSYDGQRLLFAWKKSKMEDDYHLYEMNYKTKEIRQLTSGVGVADYEGIYLPDGNIMFSSSRCVQIVDCWWTEVSNMYKCDKDGKYLRRIGFDQVHTTHPAVLNNGSVVYTRWDYNDRGQIWPQPLFQMNVDGTGQTEYYGNNSYFPTTTSHARAIPGSDKIVAVLHGHHSWQAGELAIIDRTKGTQEASGVQLIAPVRETKAVKVDRYGQDGDLFRHPYALSETEFIVPLLSGSRRAEFGLYWVHADGNRELLHYDPKISCNNPMPLQARKPPRVKPSTVDYTKKSGTYFMQDIYVGPGLEGVERGTIKALRVVALEFRAAGVGSNKNSGEAGGALVSTPISIPNGAWDVKKILGSAKVYEDGSAMFSVPANTPVYFQAIDDQGQVVQTMRSWSTLMPGEVNGCVGCHEDKLSTPMVRKRTMASKAGVQKLKPFYGPARGFSFVREVQPILDKHCIKCHKDDEEPYRRRKMEIKPDDKRTNVFTLKGDLKEDERAGRNWTQSYVNLTDNGSADSDVLNWISSQSRPSMIPPYHRGSARSIMIQKLREGHPPASKGSGVTSGKVKLSREEMDKLCAWIDLGVPFCGDYFEGNNWNENNIAKYLRYQRKREKYAEEIRRNTEALIKKEKGKNVRLPDPKPRFVEYETSSLR